MIAATGTARLVVVNSSRASGRQQVRRTKTQSSSQRSLSHLGATTSGDSSRLVGARLASGSLDPAYASTFTHSSSPRHALSSSQELAQDLSFLSSTLQGQNANAGDDASSGSASGWSRAELLASGLLALAATGSFLMASSVAASPSTAVQQAAQTTVSRFPFSKSGGGGGGGGSGGSGGGGGSPFFPRSATKENEEVNITTDEALGGSLGKPYDVSVKALKGSRLTMEDEFFLANGGRFVAVFDGHGGGGVSAFLRDSLYDHVCHHLKQKKWEQDDDSKRNASISSHVAALRSAFDQIDDEVLMNDALQYQGSTAVAVVLHEGDDGHRTLLSANVGDSRAILSRQGRAVDLTRDHKPNDEREKARIMAMGETIEWDQYCKVHRVRNLSLSRAIGDRFAKPVVSGQVEIKHFPVMDEGDEFILLASDGLWDVMSSQDVVAYVHERLDQPPPGGLMGPEDLERLKFTRRKNMSRYVATEAIKRGSCDNVCVLMVWLNDSTPKVV